MEVVEETITGDGYAVSSVDALGEGPGFRKIRVPLGVTAFGANAVVLPPGYQAGGHYHDRQQELYIVLRGQIEFEFGAGEKRRLGPGGLARVDAPTLRRFRNVSDTEEAVFVCVGGADGYVGRDGRVPEGEEAPRR